MLGLKLNHVSKREPRSYDKQVIFLIQIPLEYNDNRSRTVRNFKCISFWASMLTRLPSEGLMCVIIVEQVIIYAYMETK